jgi:exonuclease III
MHLKILSWNCQSFSTPKLDALKNFLNDCANPNSFHLILLQETWLNSKREISLPHYKCVRKDRQNGDNLRSHGGVLVFVRRDINFKAATFSNLNLMDSVFIEVETGIFPIIFGSVYSLSRMSRKDSKSDFEKLLSRGDPFVLAGDFNAKH